MHSIILSPEILTDKWFTDEPQRLLWWIDLLMVAAPVDGVTMSIDKTEETVNRGELIISYNALAKQWNTKKDLARNFIVALQRKNLVKRSPHTTLHTPSHTPCTRLTICEYGSYVPTENDSHTTLHTLCTPLEMSHTIRTLPYTPQTALESGGNDEVAHHSAHPLHTPQGEIAKEEKDEKEKKQKKKKNKEESGYALTSVCVSDADTLSQTSESELPTVKKEEKAVNIVTRCREVFESYFQELFSETYYWQAKDAVAAKGLLKKITFSRKNRKIPLPTDDDSLVDAFGQFIRSINKAWIMNNFSLPKINSQYNDIISEIRNSKNGAGAQASANVQKAAGINVLAHQAAAIFNDLAKADELYGPK